MNMKLKLKAGINNNSSMMQLTLSTILLVLAATTVSSKSFCVMNGTCGAVDTLGGSITAPCSVVHEPVRIDWKDPHLARYLAESEDSEYADPSELRANFAALCRTLDVDGPLCCARDQISSMVANMESVPKQILGSCPACFSNFAALFCSLTCSPAQGSFLRVAGVIEPTPTAETPTPPAGSKQVDSLVYSIAADWTDRLYESCARITVSGTGSTALAIMGCDDPCNGTKLVQSLGDRSKSPFEIKYQFFEPPPSGSRTSSGSSSISYMNVSTTPCNQKPSPDSFACSCSECAASCSVPADECGISEQSGSRTSVEDEVRTGTRLAWMGSSTASRAVVLGVAAVVLVTGLFVNLTSFRILIRDSDNDDDDELSAPIITESDQPARAETETEIHKNGFVERALDSWARICCRRPALVIVIGLLAIFGASFGIRTIEMVNDPVSLWSAPSSKARIQKDFFDANFGPFFRVQQVIVSSVTPGDRNFEYTFAQDNVTMNVSTLFRADLLRELLLLESDLAGLKTNETRLADICYAPLHALDHDAGIGSRCVVQSPLNYFQSNESILARANYLDHVRTCITNPTLPSDERFNNTPCLGAFGGPGFPNVVFGGFNDPDPCPGDKNSTAKPTVQFARVMTNATSLVLTFLVRNHPVGSPERERAESWEALFLDHVQSFVARHSAAGDEKWGQVTIAGQRLRVSYFSERSVEDEIARQSRSDVVTIALSYLVMFVYVSVALGQFTEVGRLFVDSKMALGLAGVLIVLGSVASSVGLTSYFGQPGTLIIVEVLPFLVLAVGVDNVFLLVQCFQRLRIEHDDDVGGSSSLEDRVARTLVSVGPSILLAAAAESACFLIGSVLSPMPAVSAFALNAALALLVCLLLQLSAFVSLLFLDSKRQSAGRADLFCCFQAAESANFDGMQEAPSRIRALFRRYFVPHVATVSRIPRVAFTTFLVLSVALTLAVIPDLPVGLEQEIAMPRDSYVLRYFEDQKSQLKVGAPVYLVLESAAAAENGAAGQLALDFDSESDQNAICGSGSCSNTSLASLLEERARESRSRITGPVSSWLDDYLTWATNPYCCMRYKNDSRLFCPSSSSAVDRKTDCEPCDGVKERRPPDFYKYLDWFLTDDPTRDCAVGGHAQYSTALSFSQAGGGKKKVVRASWFMAYHKPAPTSDHFVASVIEGRALAAQIEAAFRASNVTAKVFPYSVFYVYYEQYLSIWKDTMIALSASLAAILVVVLVSRLLGHVLNSIIFLVTLTSFLVHLMGFMYWWNISLNALSLVNLVMACGISVEFCSHVAVSFAEQSSAGASDDAARTRAVATALESTGSSVLSGITLTKLGGVLVLAFAQSRIFSVYYFRLYLGILLIGAYHGLVVLPVLLSLFGRLAQHRNRNRNRKVEEEAPNLATISTSESFSIQQQQQQNSGQEKKKEKEEEEEIDEKEGEEEEEEESSSFKKKARARSFSIESD